MKHQLEIEAQLDLMKFELGKMEEELPTLPAERVVNATISRDRWKYWIEALQWMLGPQQPDHEWSDEDFKCPKCGHQLELGKPAG